MPSRPTSADDLKLLAPFWLEPVHRWVLPNGLTLVVKPDHSAALASVQAWVKTGSIHEGEWLGGGLSHFLEHMLFKGTARRTSRQITTEVQASGGYINAYTSFDRTVYYIDLPSEHFGVAVDILADAVLHSSLPADEIAREREVIMREIAMTRDDPDQRLGETLFAAGFRSHPYRYPIIGHKDVFATVSREALLAYYKERYVPNNMVVVVVGAVDPLAVRAEVERHFGETPRARLAPVFVPDEPQQLARREQHCFEDVEVCRSALAWRIPGLSHPDAPFLDLLSTILGSGESSVLWQALREKKKLVHSIDTQSWNPGSSGMFFVSFTSDPAKRQKASSAVVAELERLKRTGLTPERIRRAIRQLAVGEINTRKTMSGQASRLGSAEVIAGDLHFTKSFFERLASATPGELRRVLRTYFVPSSLTEVSSNPLSLQTKMATEHKAAPAPQDFEEIVLKNGARILVQEDSRIPNVHLRLVCQGGPLFEQPGKRGASALLATMLTKDTKRHSAAQVAESIEGVGGSFYPFSGNNSVGLAVEVLPPDLDKAIAVLGEACLQPAFLESTLAVEREAQLADLQLDDDDVVTQGRKLLRKHFFGDYPLAIDANGDAKGVASLSRADLVALHKRLFIASNLVVAVSGAVKKAELVRKLKPFLEKAPKGEPLPKASVHVPRATLVEDVVLPREQAVVFHAFPGPVLLADDFYVGEVADEVFSGMASHLFERVREEKGLAYFVRSSRVTGLGGSMFFFFAGTAPAKVGEVLSEIEAEVERVASGLVEEAELKRCKARLKAARRQGMQTGSSRALNAGLNALLGLPINDWKTYDARIEAVDSAALAAFAKRYFRKENRVQLVIHP